MIFDRPLLRLAALWISRTAFGLAGCSLAFAAIAYYQASHSRQMYGAGEAILFLGRSACSFSSSVSRLVSRPMARSFGRPGSSSGSSLSGASADFDTDAFLSPGLVRPQGSRARLSGRRRPPCAAVRRRASLVPDKDEATGVPEMTAREAWLTIGRVIAVLLGIGMVLGVLRDHLSDVGGRPGARMDRSPWGSGRDGDPGDPPERPAEPEPAALAAGSRRAVEARTEPEPRPLCRSGGPLVTAHRRPGRELRCLGSAHSGFVEDPMRNDTSV